MNKIKIFVADQFDPWFNLATENWIFNDMDPEYHVLVLWRNSETVVIGRLQNPWTECRTKKMEEDGVKLARRQSGGGAVFHDLGNTNFTFMSSKESYDKNANNQIITAALKRFDIEAYPNGRNDIVVDTKEGVRKISGSAFKLNIDRSFHHGTLLIDANLSKLATYLNPDKKKLESKGIQSTRARLINLKELNPSLNHDNLCEAIREEFCQYYNSQCEVEVLDYAYLKTVPQLNKYYEELKDWDWVFGRTPQFNHQFETRFPWGGVEVHLNSNKGIIEEAKIFSDSLFPPLIEAFMNTLVKTAYDGSVILGQLNSLKKNYPDHQGEISDFSSWLIANIK